MTVVPFFPPRNAFNSTGDFKRLRKKMTAIHSDVLLARPARGVGCVGERRNRRYDALYWCLLMFDVEPNAKVFLWRDLTSTQFWVALWHRVDPILLLDIISVIIIVTIIKFILVNIINLIIAIVTTTPPPTTTTSSTTSTSTSTSTTTSTTTSTSTRIIIILTILLFALVLRLLLLLI